MSTIGELLPDSHVLKEKTVLDVCYQLGNRYKKETLIFSDEINEILNNYIPYDFKTPSGLYLYGLIRNPDNGTIHAFINSDDRDRVLEIYKERAKKIAEEEALDDTTEWRTPEPFRNSRFKKYSNPSDEFIKKPVIFHNAIETNRRKH